MGLDFHITGTCCVATQRVFKFTLKSKIAFVDGINFEIIQKQARLIIENPLFQVTL